MSSRFLYAFGGSLISGIVGLLFNLLASVIEHQAFSDRFNTLTIWLLVGFICFGTLLGAWLGGKITVPPAAPPSTSQAALPAPGETVSVTRLKALLSYGKLRGKGIYLKDIMLIGSRLDIDS